MAGTGNTREHGLCRIVAVLLQDDLSEMPITVGQREFVDKLLVRTHCIIVMIRWTGLLTTYWSESTLSS